jgi:hypothetical protein
VLSSLLSPFGIRAGQQNRPDVFRPIGSVIRGWYCYSVARIAFAIVAKSTYVRPFPDCSP